jgi:hypothetical protein
MNWFSICLEELRKTKKEYYVTYKYGWREVTVCKQIKTEYLIVWRVSDFMLYNDKW